MMRKRQRQRRRRNRKTKRVHDHDHVMIVMMLLLVVVHVSRLKMMPETMVGYDLCIANASEAVRNAGRWW